jgi:hypothetical protein
MTLFEYLAIAYSLVLSFAALRLVAGLPHALDPNRRYSVHLIYVFIMIFATAAAFWGQWSLRDVDWNFLFFLLTLGGPAVIYFMACTLIPDEPSSIGSWQDHFFSVRRSFFGGFCIWALFQAMASALLLHVPLFHPFRLVQSGILVLGVAGLASDRPSVHRMILIFAAVVAIFTAFVFLQPGTLSA